MADPIVPVIGSNSDAYNYCNISAAQAAANLPNGSITLASYISTLMQRAAAEIVGFINFDYTIAQVIKLNFRGHGGNLLKVEHPAGAISTFKSWEPSNVIAGVTNIGPTALTVNAVNPYFMYRNDGNNFESNLMYYLEYLQTADPQAPATSAGWPQDIMQIQVEMVAMVYKQSWNKQGSLDWATEPEVEGQRIKLLEMNPIFKDRLRPYKHYTI